MFSLGLKNEFETAVVNEPLKFYCTASYLDDDHKVPCACDKVVTLTFAGADFIKTSTGKEGVNAILPVALVMVRAIREYFYKTGHKVN